MLLNTFFFKFLMEERMFVCIDMDNEKKVKCCRVVGGKQHLENV